MINLLQSSKKKYKLFLNYELHEWCKCDLGRENLMNFGLSSCCVFGPINVAWLSN